MAKTLKRRNLKKNGGGLLDMLFPKKAAPAPVEIKPLAPVEVKPLAPVEVKPLAPVEVKQKIDQLDMKYNGGKNKSNKSKKSKQSKKSKKTNKSKK